MTTQSQHPRKRFLLVANRRAVALTSVLVMVAPVGALTLSAGPAQAATVPSYSISPRAVDIQAGGSAQLTVRFTRNRPPLRWAISGLPTGVQAGFVCSSLRVCALSLAVSPGASTGTSFVELQLSSGGSRRVVPFALGVQPRGFVQPAPVPTLPPVTSPPVTAPPITLPTIPQPTVPPPPVTQPPVARNFALQPTSLKQTVKPGGNVSFGVGLARVGWSGPIDLRVETLPPTWRAAFIPSNPSSENSTTLLLTVPANAPVADYPIRISGISGSSISTSTLTVQVRVPRPSLTLQSVPPIEAGRTGRFVVDARSLDDARLPVTLSVEGLPAGIAPTFTANPTIGSTGIDFAVNSNVPPGNYQITLVASRDGVQARVTAVLTVTPAVSTAFKFITTPVTPVAGDRVAYGLSASTASLLVTRGTTTTFDVRVIPTGGFAGAIDVAMDLPAGWTVSYSVVGTNLFRATLNVPANSGLGIGTLVVRSSSGNLSAAVNVTVNVR